MLVNEIFRSLQGESTYAGLPCTFIRLTGCNLRCVWCDTTHAFYEGVEHTLEEILQRVRSYPMDLIEITGGEPLLQKETELLCRSLLASGATVLLETNGSLDIDLAPPGVIRIIDIKTPSSHEHGAWNEKNVARLRSGDEIKFVIADADDFDYAVAAVRQYEFAGRYPVLLSPLLGKMALPDLSEWILKSELPLRMQMQLHKIIWDPEQRGV